MRGVFALTVLVIGVPAVGVPLVEARVEDAPVGRDRVVATALAAGVDTAPAPPAPAEAGCGWGPPTEADVVDPFRRPEHRYGPGNRGLEYDTTDGQEVTAVAGGQVAFTGPVGGSQYVVVDHGHDLRSTYGPLAGIAVVGGQQIGEGELVGEAATGFHLTARRGDHYIDPEPLLSGACSQLRLVPPPPPPPPEAE